jgi:hypothetical protein
MHFNKSKMKGISLSMPQIAAIFTGSFHALKNKNFRYFLMGQSLAFTGTWVQRSAQIWLVYSLTNSPLLVGILACASSCQI